MAHDSGTTVRDHGGELALAALRPLRRRRAVHALGRAHLPALRRRGEARPPSASSTSATSRRPPSPPRATAKLTRRPGRRRAHRRARRHQRHVSAVTTAHFNGSPLVVLGGRAPQARWGAGSLQEFDHVPVAGADHQASPAPSTAADDIADGGRTRRPRTALTPHRGPVFVDFPLDVVFAEGEAAIPAAAVPAGAEPDPDESAGAAALIAAAERPAVIAGSDVWWDGRRGRAAGGASRRLRVPDLRQRPGPGLPARRPRAGLQPHPRAAEDRGRRGGRRRHAARLPAVVRPVRRRATSSTSSTADERAGHVHVAAVAVAGDLRTMLGGLAGYDGRRADHEPWIARAPRRRGRPRAAAEAAAARRRRRPDQADAHLRRAAAAARPRRGGRHATAATSCPTPGKYVDVYEPGCWLDPGPYGCLGTGHGLRHRRPDRPPRPPGRGAARRRRRRVLAHGRRHARPPRASRS